MTKVFCGRLIWLLAHLLALGCAAIFGSKRIWSEYLFASKRIKLLFASFAWNESADFTCEYFQKEPNIYWGLRVVKVFSRLFEAMRSEYSMVGEYLQANIRLKLCEYSILNEYFWSKYTPSWEKHVFFASNGIFVCESVPLFWSENEANDANKLCLRIYRNMRIWSE